MGRSATRAIVAFRPKAGEAEMNVEAHIDTRRWQPRTDQNRLLAGLRLDPVKRLPQLPPQTAAESSDPLDAETVRRLHEENPFFRARADRYNQLNAAIMAVEASVEATTSARKYLDMLKRRREDILSELVSLVAEKTPPQPLPIWNTAAQSHHVVPTRPAPSTRSWDWP